MTDNKEPKMHWGCAHLEIEMADGRRCVHQLYRTADIELAKSMEMLWEIYINRKIPYIHVRALEEIMRNWVIPNLDIKNVECLRFYGDAIAVEDATGHWTFWKTEEMAKRYQNKLKKQQR